VEILLAVLLLVAPAVMWGFDTGLDNAPGPSISYFHEEGEPPAFYVPLTMVAMLFLVNGFMSRGDGRGHWYNVALGAALLGLVVFDHDGSTSGLHGAFTIAFFVGNVAAVVLFSEIAWSWLKPLIVVGIVVVAALWALDQVSTFFAEWLAMGLISVHFILDSWPTEAAKKYRALRSNERPALPFGPRRRPAAAAG
jgi:hypothetical protein